MSGSWARRAAACVAVSVACATVDAAAADDGVEASPARTSDPAAPQALGRVFVAGPTPATLVFVSSGGYGYTESVLHTGDAHHRAAGSVGLEGRPLDWLGLALRLDGRYDRHDSAQGTDDGWVGDPRVFVRVDHALGSVLRAGARLGVWFPGGTAPSINLSATTPELTGALACAVPGAPLWLAANAGYRVNRSARTATDASMLSASDRLGLELSAFDQALLGLAAVYGAGRAQAFLEVDAELMVGAGSPPISQSPLRAGGGVRIALTRALRLETAADVVVGARPDLSASSPLVPVPPRASFWLGLAYRVGARPEPRPAHHVEAPPAAVPVAPARGTVDGRVTAGDGASLKDIRVIVQRGAAEATVEVDGEGGFTLDGNAGEKLTVRAEAAGYDAATETVTIAEGSTTTVTLTLQRKLPSGQIRGLVRSFKGVGLEAEVKVEPGDRALHTQDGRFEVDVAPGPYDVTITAPGFETQRRHVEVEQNGVTLLNADLRSKR